MRVLKMCGDVIFLLHMQMPVHQNRDLCVSWKAWQ